MTARIREDEHDDAYELESALIAVLAGMLGGGAVGTVATTPQQVRTLIDPVLTPLLIGMMLRMRQAGALDGAAPPPSSFTEQVFNDSRAAVDDAADLIFSMIKRVQTEPLVAALYYRIDTAVDPRLVKEARRLARAVATSVAESTKIKTAKVSGFTKKMWNTRQDDRVRPAHVFLEGAITPISGGFQTASGEILDRPGDTSASPGLWMGCRCFLTYL